MSAERNGPISLAIVRNDNLELDTNALYHFLNQEHIQGRPLVVISIAGAFRSGKSFVMNFFLRYLRNRGWRNENWFGDDDTPITGGFPSRRGKDACTQGITVWPEVFIVPTVDGRKAAVILVDTQGLFDKNTSPDTNAKLMSVSTLFSSHQILNLQRQIEERDLEHLQLCIEFARAAAMLSQPGGGNSFQKLMFLVRDWEHGDDLEKPDRYLSSVFSERSQSAAVQKVKDSIPSAFDRLECTLLPHPGTKVTKQVENLSNKDVDEDFRRSVAKLACGVLHSKNLVIKRSRDGSEETTRGLLQLLATVGKSFKSGRVPTVDTLLEGVTKGNNIKALTDSVAKYRAQMKKECRGILDATVLQGYHRQCLQDAVEHFRALATIGDKASKDEFQKQMEKECEQALDSFRDRNRSKMDCKIQEFRKRMMESVEIYTRKMKQVRITDEERAFERTHDDCSQQLMSEFRFYTKHYGTMPEIQLLQKELDDTIVLRHVEAKEIWTEKKLRKKAEDEEESSNCKYSIEKEFEKQAEKYHGRYVPDLERIVESFKRTKMKEYDQRMTGNPERRAVQENRRDLEQNLQRVIEQAERYNSERRDSKSSEFRLKMHQCLTECKAAMKTAYWDETMMSEKKKAIGKFDSATAGFQNLPEVKEYKSQLERDIDTAKAEIIEDRQKKKEIRDSQLRRNANAVAEELVGNFDTEAAKYGSRYFDDVKEKLDQLKKEYVGKLDQELIGNPFKAKLPFEKRLGGIITRAIGINDKNRAILEADIKILKQKCTQDFEDALEKPMNDGVLEESAFVGHKKQFLQKLRGDDDYKKLPGWAQAQVVSGIEDSLTKLRNRNESNRKYRSATVSSPSFFKWLWNGVKAFFSGVAELLGF